MLCYVFVKLFRVEYGKKEINKHVSSLSEGVRKGSCSLFGAPLPFFGPFHTPFSLQSFPSLLLWFYSSSVAMRKATDLAEIWSYYGMVLMSFCCQAFALLAAAEVLVPTSPKPFPVTLKASPTLLPSFENPTIQTVAMRATTRAYSTFWGVLNKD